ncbi:hypothetical protein [Roseivirga sp. 4D4]|uniref:hypothetical protein n=1 Tax=Roseivirga sp. 4D4 TaxID=1889784 RepID=UPI001112E863|nr:hypothetical protein [Roseivirga sp. 4D4]
MKKKLLLLSALVLIISCSSGEDDNPFQVITGEIEQSFTIDWRSLPSNQNIAITNPERIQELRFVTIADFDVQDADEFLDPTISAMYYDISGWETVNSVGIFDVTISILDDFGFPTRLTSFSISNLDNTVTLNNNQTVLSKEVIFDATNGTVTFDGLAIANRSLLLGRLNIELEIAGRNVLLQAPDQFELTLSLDLEALASINEE